MPVEHVISKRITISRKGQIHYFLMNLPENTLEVIGVETSYISQVNFLYENPAVVPLDANLLPYNRSLLVGELRLQSMEKANVFYARHIQSDGNTSFGDYSVKPGFTPADWTHFGEREPEPVSVPGGSTVIRGMYTDQLGNYMGTNPAYSLSIYLWLRMAEKAKPQTAQ